MARTKKKLPWLCRMGRHAWEVMGGTETLRTMRCRRCKEWETVRA